MAPGATFVSITAMTKIKHCNVTPLISCNVADYGYELNARLFFVFQFPQLGFSAFIMTQSVLLVKSVTAIYMSANLSASSELPEKRDSFQSKAGKQKQTVDESSSPSFCVHPSWPGRAHKELFKTAHLVNNP